MKYFMLIIFYWLLSFPEDANTQAKYYLSSSNGSDTNSGSIHAPWQNLSKINSTILNPGDSIFFKSGDRFNGHFVINGSGTTNKPIIITRYGSGDKPIISGSVGLEGGGDYQEAILINNQDHIVIDGLEVNNERLVNRSGINEEKSYGIQVLNDGDRVLRNFHFKNLTIRNVYAVKSITEQDQQAFNSIEVAGIRIFSTINTTKSQKNIQDVIIEDSYFTDLQRFGIHFKHNGGDAGVGDEFINRNTNIICRNNEFYYLGGTSILPQRTYNCLIENNIFDHPGASTDPRMPARGSSVWTYRSVNTVIQYNQCISARGYFDSYGIHIDHFNKNTFIQYNYMEDCEGGFVEILKGNLNSVYRFNVSFNDGFRQHPTWKNSNHTIWIDAEAHTDNPAYCDSSYIYNNSVIINRPFTTAIAINAKNTFVFNNIFQSINGGYMGQQQEVFKDNGTTLLISNNMFHGQISNVFQNLDENKIIADPQFANEEESKDRFQLQENSPAIDKGLAIDVPIIPGAGKGVFQNLTPYPTVDFYGNPLEWGNGKVNIGSFNGKVGIRTAVFENDTVDKGYFVYPVPSESKVFIKLGKEAEIPSRISLVNMKGQIVQIKHDLTREEEHLYSIEIDSSLPNGIYILHLKTAQKTYTRRLVLAR
jgi:hypothetical protein